MDKLLLFLKNILNQNWVEATFNERKKFVNYLNTTIKEELKIINNTNIITLENFELYIFNLYNELLKKIKKKIVYYESPTNSKDIKSEKIKSCNKLIAEMKKELYKPNIPKLMTKEIKKSITTFASK